MVNYIVHLRSVSTEMYEEFQMIFQCEYNYLKAAYSVTFDSLILEIKFLFFKNTVKILKFR